MMDFSEEVQEVSTQLSLSQLGLDPECKWTQAALAQKLGVIQQTINSWISDIRARQRASRKRVSEIVGNTNFSEIDTLLSQGHDMDHMNILNRSGWEITHIIDCPMSTQRFQANIVAQMQKNRTLGIVRRSLIIGRKK